ncbi:aldo/keto reductase [Pacificoceanicola onchidii]|uniref:aldo/keto reductase n=1 Tax=Pacificoceanicola onchidii TaxID=2562685 RepID=UPI0010A31B49|nr:aldo/keto reductase [Pacificoceanicola onchidii]
MTDLTAPNGSQATRLCYGCMQFGGTADANASRAMFDACRAAGINSFDTAHLYTGGASETLLGGFIKSEREALIIASKVGYTGGAGRETILTQFDESRRRLDLDTVDILYLHRWDPDTALEESFETLCTLQQSGRIRYIGLSNFAAWQVMKAACVAARFGTGIDVLQPMYSLVKRQAEVELLPMALSEGISVMPYSPLGSGLLTGKYQSGGTGRLSDDPRYAARYDQAWMRQTAEALSDMARDMETSPATLAVAWAAQHPAVTAPIISARNCTQLQPSLDAMRLTLSADQYAAIEALSQRPAPATDRLEEG